MTQTVNDFLLGGGAASAKFAQLGDTVTGTITVTPQLRQQTDYKTRKPMFWDDGQPKMQVVVTLQTDQRAAADDDGTRSVYIKGDMQRATREALRASGAKGLEVGGTLTVVFVGEEPTSGDPKKLYQATYLPPSNAAVNAFVTGQVAQQPQQPMQQVPQTGWDQQVQQQGPPPGWAAPAPQQPMQQPVQQVQQPPVQQQLPPQAPAQPAAVDPNVVAAFRNLPPDQQDALTKGQPALRAALGLPAA